MGATHSVNPLQSRRHLLANMVKRKPTLFDAKGFTSKIEAKHYADKVGATIAPGAVYLRADGTYAPLVMLDAGHWWMVEHVNYMGCVAWPAEYPLPSPGLAQIEG